MKDLIPRLPHAFFRWYCRKDRYEELHGDLEEMFYERVGKYGRRRAQLLYWRDVVRCCQPYAWKRSSKPPVSTHTGMFHNYFKISFRNLIKNPLSSFINVFGLAVAIGITLLVYTFIEYDNSIDQFHENKHEVFLATFHADRNGYQSQFGNTPRPLAGMLAADFKQIKRTCRVEDRRLVIKREDNVFHEDIRFTDPAFLEMLTFPMKWGSAQSLRERHNIVLSSDMSLKYFGAENPVGREMLVIFNDSVKQVFTVSAVARPFPKAHDIGFDFLLHFDNLPEYDRSYDPHDWSRFVRATLVQVERPEEISAIAAGTDKYRKMQNEVAPEWQITGFTFEPLATLHEHAYNIRDGIVRDDSVEGRIGMPIIAVFMIVLACLNYINIAIVSASKRLKEIGIRKSIGANRMKVMTQFLLENVFVTGFALLLGVALCAFVFLPWFVQFTGWPLEMRLLEPNIWLFVGILVIVTGVASGIYPAVYISSFDAVSIFRGSQHFGRKNPFTKAFLAVQLVLACIIITCAVVFTQNNSYQYSRSWGYEQLTSLYVAVPDRAAYEKMKATMTQYPDVVAVSGSADHLGRSAQNVLVESQPGMHQEVSQFAVDAGYAHTMGLTLKEGRWFTPDSENDRRVVVVNNTLVEKLKLARPVGSLIKIDSNRYEIVGVMNEFHHKNFFHRIEPMLFRVADEGDYRFLSLKVRQGSQERIHAVLTKEWSALYPETPMEGGYQEHLWTGYFFQVDRSETFTNVVAFIAVMLAGLGVYGLVSLNVSGRMKEFSIRRTLGAGVRHIFAVVIRQYRVLTVVALIIGAPLSYLFAQAYLDMLFAYPMPMDFSGIVIAVALLLVVLLLVVSTQIRKVVTNNAVTDLKSE